MVNIEQLYNQISPVSQQAVSPLLSRWDGFAQKIRERAGEIQAEATPGLDQIVALDPTNTGPISAAFSAVESRIRSLTDKIQEAEEKLSESWDEATDDLDIEGQELASLARIESALVEQSRALQRELEMQNELLTIVKRADWARALYQIAQSEQAKQRECSQCAAPLNIEMVWQACNVTCAHCGAVGMVSPGPATGMYFQGSGIHDLARESAREAWIGSQHAEHWFKELRLPTEDDFQRYLGSARDFWTDYHNACAHYHPGWGQTIEAATEAKMAHYTAYEQATERSERARNGQIVSLSAARDRNGLGQLLSSGSIDADEAARAPFERGDFDGAALIFGIGHQLEGSDEPLAEYIGERMADLAR